MKSLQRIGLLLSIAFLSFSCQLNVITGSGNVVSEKRNIEGNFIGIEASDGLDIILEQANEKSVTVIADDNLQKHIKVIIVDDILKISSDYKAYRNVKMKKVSVRMPEIRSIKISSGTHLKTKNGIICKSIDIKASSGADVNVTLEAEKTIGEASSGSVLKIQGKSIDFECAASSGSQLDARKLMSNNVIASASSGSSSDVYPLVNLNAKASSGASITYFNVPKNLTKKSSSGGNISHQ